MIQRISEHLTDTKSAGQTWTRKIAPWQNYRTKAGLIVPASCAKETAVAVPADWGGAFDFKSQALACSCQSFVEDSDGAKTSTAFWGLRLSDRPDVWMNWRAIDGQQNKTFTEGNKTTWVDLWPSCDLTITQRPSEVRKIITLKEPAHVGSFGFSLLLAPGMSYQTKGGILTIQDATGKTVYKTSRVYGEDAWRDPEAPNLRHYVRCTFEEGEPFDRVPTFWITPDPKDLEGAQYPVEIDPTTVIDSDTDLLDTGLYSNSVHQCPGNTPEIYMNSTGYVGLMKYDEALSPDGTITALRALLRADTVGKTATISRVKEANAWVPGTNGTPDIGACSWSHCIEDTQHWIGGGDFSSADYDAGGYDSGAFAGSYGLTTIALNADWATAWRDATHVNNGIAIVDNGSGWWTIATRQAANTLYDPHFEIDYTPNGGPAKFFLARRT